MSENRDNNCKNGHHDYIDHEILDYHLLKTCKTCKRVFLEDIRYSKIHNDTATPEIKITPVSRR